MKLHSFKWFMAGTLMIASLTGCGGGSSPAAVQPPPSDSVVKTTIKGTASAGIIYPGTVNVYEVKSDGTKGVLLAGSVQTDINGTYSAALGTYSGAIQVEVSGTYKDEATSKDVTIDPAKPLHALVEVTDNSANNNRVVSVTPLTEVAWRKASTNGTKATTAAGIVSANKLVKDLFKVSDIIGIEPVRLDSASMANASQESQAYTLALASLSKMASSSTGTTEAEKLDSCLNTLETEVESAETHGSMSSGTMNSLSDALTSVSLGTEFQSAKDQLSNMGKMSKKITLSTSGKLPAGTKIYSIEGTIALPVDSATSTLKVSLRSDSNNMTLADVFMLAGNASGKGGIDPVANFLAPQQQVDFSIVLSPTGPGIDIGDFATLAYDVASGFTVSAADFSIVSASVKDANGADISGVTITIK